MKKRLFISSILMTLVLLVAITTATFAWYSVSVSMGVAGSTKQVNTVTSAVQTGALTIEFTLETNESPKLSDGSGKTYVYTQGQTPGTDNPTEVAAEYTDLFGTMSIVISKIYLSSDTENKTDISGQANTMKGYAGTYNYEIYVSAGNGVMSLTAPTNAATVGSGLTNSDIAIKVVISGADGSVALQDNNGNALSQFFFGVRGAAQDESAGANATFAVRIPN